MGEEPDRSAEGGRGAEEARISPTEGSALFGWGWSKAASDSGAHRTSRGSWARPSRRSRSGREDPQEGRAPAAGSSSDAGPTPSRPRPRGAAGPPGTTSSTGCSPFGARHPWLTGVGMTLPVSPCRRKHALRRRQTSRRTCIFTGRGGGLRQHDACHAVAWRRHADTWRARQASRRRPPSRPPPRPLQAPAGSAQRAAPSRRRRPALPWNHREARGPLDGRRGRPSSPGARHAPADGGRTPRMRRRGARAAAGEPRAPV